MIDDDLEDEKDDWEKPEEEERMGPDFDEFDIPKSRGKKSGKKDGDDDDDFKFDDDLKEFDLFNDSGSFDDDDDDDF
jgi:nucleolin